MAVKEIFLSFGSETEVTHLVRRLREDLEREGYGGTNPAQHRCQP